MPINTDFWRPILTRKVGQVDFFGMWSEFIIRSVHKRLRGRVCSSYDLCHLG